MMKKVLLVSLALLPYVGLALPTGAQAASGPVCDGGVGGNQTVSTDSKFVVNAFTMKCSANVFLNYLEDTTAIGVASTSKKGKNIFAGGSAGGQVKPVGTCTTCDAGSLTSAILTTAKNGS